MSDLPIWMVALAGFDMANDGFPRGGVAHGFLAGAHRDFLLGTDFNRIDSNSSLARLGMAFAIIGSMEIKMLLTRAGENRGSGVGLPPVYYIACLGIGTPPQEFALIVDTGSDLTHVPCFNCESCGHHQNADFQPDLSSTYKPVKCNMDYTCDESHVQCTYKRYYAEMSSSRGVLGEDIFFFGEESTLDLQHVIFGCANEETGNLSIQHADGIFGLGRGRHSIMDQLISKGVVGNSFSLCFGGMGIGGGAMILGGISFPADMIFSHSDPTRSEYHNIELKEIHVAKKPLKLNAKNFDNEHGTVLDSGSTYTYLPEAAFVEFKNSIVEKLHSLKKIDGPDPNYNDICFFDAGSDASKPSKFFPEVEMVFGNGQKLSLAPENYLFQHPKVQGGYCLGVFKTENDATTILGGIFFRNTLVTYDGENQRIGFWKTNCSELWERLHSR